MKGGSVKVVRIESTTFELRVVGTYEDILKLSKQGRGRSFSIFLPEPVALWLLRAWGRFRNSKSSTWCNQMRLSSRIYVLEFKSNGAGKFLKLSVSKEGNRAFVIFPSGWKNKGWVQVFDSIAGILGKSASMPVVHGKVTVLRHSSPEVLLGVQHILHHHHPWVAALNAVLQGF